MILLLKRKIKYKKFINKNNKICKNERSIRKKSQSCLGYCTLEKINLCKNYSKI